MGAEHSNHSERPDWAASAQAQAAAIDRAQGAYQKAACEAACKAECEAKCEERDARAALQAAMRAAEEAQQRYEAEQAEATRRARVVHEEAKWHCREEEQAEQAGHAAREAAEAAEARAEEDAG